MTTLPPLLRKALPVDTARTWVLLRDHLPEPLVLYGGTALAAHLHHRVSRDLDFFYPDDVDLTTWRETLDSLGRFAVTTAEPDTLNGVFNSTKVQFLQARGQTPLEPPTIIAGIKVASLRDIAATKLKTIADRGALRDYFDLMTIEQRSAITMETALLDYQERYQTHDMNTITHIIRALGTFSDVGDDHGLPVRRTTIEDYWARRTPNLGLSVDVTGTLSLTLPPRVDPESDGWPLPPPDPSNLPAGRVWVEAHERNGRQVRGYWRRR